MDEPSIGWLESAIEVRKRLNAETRLKIRMGDYPELLELLYELNDSGRTASPELARILSTTTSVLNKFFYDKSPINLATARAVADRIVTYLRSEENQSRAYIENNALTTNIDKLEKREAQLVVKAVEWKVLVRSTELQDKISQIVVLIGEVTRCATTTNLPPDERALSPIERAQLIAVLETALNLLKSPMVEKGMLKKAGDLAKRTAAKVAEKQVEAALGKAAGALGSAILEFLKRL